MEGEGEQEKELTPVVAVATGFSRKQSCPSMYHPPLFPGSSSIILTPTTVRCCSGTPHPPSARQIQANLVQLHSKSRTPLSPRPLAFNKRRARRTL